MLITILVTIIMIVSWVLYLKYSRRDSEFIIVMITAPFVVFFLLFGASLLFRSEDIKDKEYQKYILELRYENLDNGVESKELVLERIITFNKSIKKHEKNSKNIWISWFYIKEFAEIGIIEI